jgi:DNA-binding transcriptional ArsR family regulator
MVERFAPLDAPYAALAHPVRRRILERLRDGEARVTDLAAAWPLSLNAVSKHIKVLESAGLLDRRVVGREHRLALRPEPLRAAAGYLEQYRAFWESGLDRLDALLREQRATGSWIRDPRHGR